MVTDCGTTPGFHQHGRGWMGAGLADKPLVTLNSHCAEIQIVILLTVSGPDSKTRYMYPSM